MILADINIETPVKFIQEKITIDMANFKPHDIKETTEWSHRHLKNEKWFVQLDCISGKFKRWKLVK